MKISVHCAVMFMVALAFSSCSSTPEKQYVREAVPIEIQKGKPVVFEIDAGHDVGIRCSPGVWDALTNSPRPLQVRLVSSNMPGTKIRHVHPGEPNMGTLGYMTNVYYLFWIEGAYHAKATVKITFPNAPEGTTSAEIIIDKFPKTSF